MRRAVADQIKALEELSEIVTRSGRAYDVSQPAPVIAERAAQPVPPRRVEPARAAEPPRAPEPPRPEAQRPRTAARPANAKTSERGGGWISDLLARADSEEPPVSPNASAKPIQPAQRLEAISLDVARMIDHAAAADAWDRYRRGETNAFSRRIYVGRGPQTFDEIRRRYGLDPEFHATVDRYVQEFERLWPNSARMRQARPSPRVSFVGDRQGLHLARPCGGQTELNRALRLDQTAASRPVSRVLYGARFRARMAIPLGRPLRAASSNQPGQRSGDESRLLSRETPCVAPIRFCSRWGLPCRSCCRGARCALTAPFHPCLAAVCFLWRFPWGRPRRTLSGTVSPWSPDFPPPLKAAAIRPAGPIHIGALAISSIIELATRAWSNAARG